jgi:hypothetical protein
MGKSYISNIKTKDEFLIHFNKFFEKLKNKQQKTIVEEMLLKRFIDVDNFIQNNTPLAFNKEGYDNFLPFFEFEGGMDPFVKKQSDFWIEAVDLMNYFVQNY